MLDLTINKQKIENKTFLLGVTGGIAAYRSLELLRMLKKQGAAVKVILTSGAEQFITPLTFEALGVKVYRNSERATHSAPMLHIDLARWADYLLIAPATAHLLAKLAYGLADDLLTTVCLATQAPLFLAPAMNTNMWAHPATRANCATLKARGAYLIGPGQGELACGDVGIGRMEEPAAIFEAICNRIPKLTKPLKKNSTRAAYNVNSDVKTNGLAGLTVLITAGPTQEAIDPVRFLTNRSSGKMGYAMAQVAVELGAQVILVSGPTQLAVPPGVECVPVCSADQMYKAVMQRVHACDVFVGVAAVADYKPVEYQQSKIKKSGKPMALNLEPTPDIIASVAALEDKPFVIGFAAQTGELETAARGKLRDKKLDVIIANSVSHQGLGFGSDENAVTVFWSNGQKVLPRASKQSLALSLWTDLSMHIRQGVAL